MGATRCVRPGWRYPFFEIAFVSDIVGLAVLSEYSAIVDSSRMLATRLARDGSTQNGRLSYAQLPV